MTGLVLTELKGKFSSGIEGALASTLNHDFQYKKKDTLNFAFGEISQFIWKTASHFIMI